MMDLLNILQKSNDIYMLLTCYDKNTSMINDQKNRS